MRKGKNKLITIRSHKMSFKKAPERIELEINQVLIKIY